MVPFPPYSHGFYISFDFFFIVFQPIPWKITRLSLSPVSVWKI